jgi:hypothetical protein
MTHTRQMAKMTMERSHTEERDYQDALFHKQQEEKGNPTNPARKRGKRGGDGGGGNDKTATESLGGVLVEEGKAKKEKNDGGDQASTEIRNDGKVENSEAGNSNETGSEEKEEKGHDMEKRKLQCSTLFHHHIDVDVFKKIF